MFILRRTENAHIDPPEAAFVEFSHHDSLRAAVRAMDTDRSHTSGGTGTWAHNYRILDDSGKEVGIDEIRFARMLNLRASDAAATLGKLGGSKTSPRKAARSAANGKLGGRPRKA